MTTTAEIDRVFKFKAMVDNIRHRIVRAEHDGCPDLLAAVELAALNAAMMRQHRVVTNHGTLIVAETDAEFKNWTIYFDDLLGMASEALLKRALGT